MKKDKGLIFTDYDEKKFIQLDYIKDINTLVAKDIFCMVEMKRSNRVDVYNLRYTKLINTVSNIGGMVKLITMIGTTLTFFYSRNKYDFDLVNQLFYISKISYQKSNCKVVHSFTKECSITNSNASIVGGFDLIKIKTKSNKTLNLKLNNKIQNIVMIKRSNLIKEEIDANLRHLFCYTLQGRNDAFAS